MRGLRENVGVDELSSRQSDYLSGYPAKTARWGLTRRIRLQREGLPGQIDLAEEALRLGLGRRTGQWYEASSTPIEPVPIPPRLTL